MYESKETQLEHELMKVKSELASTKDQLEEAQHVAAERMATINAIDQEVEPLKKKITKLQSDILNEKAAAKRAERRYEDEVMSHQRALNRAESRWCCVYIILIIILVLNIVNLIFLR